jgi:hypothetical protein
MASPTWPTTIKAALKEANFTQSLDGITEYWEVWTGKKDDATYWPAYVAGAGCTPAVAYHGVTWPGDLYWYSINAESGQNKASATYTARASNRFSKPKWSMDFSMESVQFLSGGSSGVLITAPYLTPVVTKTSYSVTVPAVTGLGPGTPASPPFTLPSMTAPPALPSFTGAYWGWYKTNCDPSLTTEGWQLTERWKWIKIIGTP